MIYYFIIKAKLLKRYKRYRREYDKVQELYVTYAIGDNEYLQKDSDLIKRMDELRSIIRLLHLDPFRRVDK